MIKVVPYTKTSTRNKLRFRRNAGRVVAFSGGQAGDFDVWLLDTKAMYLIVLN
jgi:hypothetical protein